MSRKLTTILAIAGILVFTVASVAPLVSPAVKQWQRSEYQSGVPFFVLLMGELIGIGLFMAAYTGAFIKLSRLQQNRWVWALGIGVALAITGYGAIITAIVLLAYCFFGPTTAAVQSAEKPPAQGQ